MRTRIAIAILIVIAAGVGIWAALGTRESAAERLVPAWQLLPAQSYRAMGVLDPFLSWSPDSRSVIFSVFGLGSQRDKIFRWRVGEKKLEYITAGVSPHFVTADEFIYMKKLPKGIFLRSLRTGKEREVAALLKKNELFPEITGFSYDPERKTITVRMTEWTRFRTFGPDEYDLEGRHVGPVYSRLGENIVDWSPDPKSSKCAILVQQDRGRILSLQIAHGSRSRGREIARGDLNAVAWSPDGRTLAYAFDKTVVAVRVADLRRAVVGRFGNPDDESDKRCAARLIWSPNGDYLAVLVYVSDPQGDYPFYYVLDMSKLKWE
ncbi:MAG: hypothetical protein ACP5R5_01000 [Armatimonadota bacterium]